MILSKCPHCRAQLGSFMYATACPHCRQELVHNRVPSEVTVKLDPDRKRAWPVQLFNRVVRIVEA